MNCLAMRDERGSSNDRDCPSLYTFELVKFKYHEIRRLKIQQKSRLDRSSTLR